MSKGNTFENDLLALIFNGDAIANLADDSSLPLTDLYVSLHTADPGEAGDQTTNEASYSTYARVAVARTSGGWTVTDNSVSPAANIEFGEGGVADNETITHFAVGTASTGTGKILYSGTIDPDITVTEGVIPRINTSSTITED